MDDSYSDESDDTDFENEEFDIANILGSLPGFGEDLYLRMQATNLHMVDGYLRELESSLLREYMEIERTPVPSTMFVSALSQLWIMGLYELLRTWRQRVRSVLTFAETLRDATESERSSIVAEERRSFERGPQYPEGIATFAFRVYETVVDHPEYTDTLRVAYDSSELLYRRLEALRMSLAKHEIPGRKGVAAMAPGYGRIDMLTGSITWQVELTEHEVDVVSRRAIANAIPAMAESNQSRVLEPALQAKIRQLPKMSYALKRVVALLDDGTHAPGTLVAWNKIIVAVLGNDDVPFDADRVVDVWLDTTPLSDEPVSDF